MNILEKCLDSKNLLKEKAEEILKEINILSKGCLKIEVQYFEDKEFFIQETKIESESELATFIEFLFLHYREKIKIYKRKKNQSTFELTREIPKGEIKEIYRISQKGKVLLVELENGKYCFLKAKSSPVYYDNIKLIESYVVCEIGNKQYLCDLNGLDVKKNYVITYRNGNYIELTKDDKNKKDKSKIYLILKGKSYYEVENTLKFEEINIMALEVKDASNIKKGIYLKDLKGSPVVDEKIKATLKSCHILKGIFYLQNQNLELPNFKYLSVIEKNERNTKREIGGTNKTLEKKEYLIIPLFANTQHLHVILEDLIKFKGNIVEDNVEQFEKNKKKHIEYKKIFPTIKEESEDEARILIIALYKNHGENKNFLKIKYIYKHKDKANGIGRCFSIKEKEEINTLPTFRVTHDEIKKIYEKECL